MIIGTWGSNKNFWGGGRISAVTNATHLNYIGNWIESTRTQNRREH